jgi:hypothetical protein
VQAQGIDLEDDAVGAIIERREQALELRDARIRASEVECESMVRLDGESPFGELAEQVVLGGHGQLLSQRLDVEAEDA